MNLKEALTNFIKGHYGLQVELQELVGYDDLNFLASNKESNKYVIKLMSDKTHPEFVLSQIELMEFIQSKSLEIKIPKVIKTKAKEQFVLFEFQKSKRVLWIIGFLEGTIYADFKPHSYDLIVSLAEKAANLSIAIGELQPSRKLPEHDWCLTAANQSRQYIGLANKKIQTILTEVFEDYNKISNELLKLPHQIIHGDINDYNLIVSTANNGVPYVEGLFDFGDMAFQPRICELAILLAYGLMNQNDPIDVMLTIIKTYCDIVKFEEVEIRNLLTLIEIRLTISIVQSYYGASINPENEYLSQSRAPAEKLLNRLRTENRNILQQKILFASNHSPYKTIHKIIEDQDFDALLFNAENDFEIIDLSFSSKYLGADPTSHQYDALSDSLNNLERINPGKVLVGRYLEVRNLYQSSNFDKTNYPIQKKRNTHLGLDFFAAHGTPILAAFDGEVYDAKIIDIHLDYGGVVMLKHNIAQLCFYTLYGHLSHQSVSKLKQGQSIKAGEPFVELGDYKENGNWPPHLHFQLILDDFGLKCDFPGVIANDEKDFWSSISMNPGLILKGLNHNVVAETENDSNILDKRESLLAKNLSISYKKGIHMKCAFKQFMYDQNGNAYLDFYNNVPHVGHQNKHVTNAIILQTKLLNTNTRYLHENILSYTTHLLKYFPSELNKCYLVNSASEANELALRLARNYTDRKEVIVTQHAYHGHTSNLIAMSPYKYNGPGGSGKENWIHEIVNPDDYRGEFKKDDKKAAIKYAQQLKSLLDNRGDKIAAFFAETYPSVAGQIIPPKGYLKNAYQILRAHDVLCIADEVQTGFGRLGKYFWAFEEQEVIPDIVVLGKPIANGYPMGAVIVKEEVANRFDNGMEFFSTFGGNPVACAAAKAVLEEVESEGLQANAEEMGSLIINGLKNLQKQFSIIGDVRGMGLFIGIEFVLDENLTPATKQAKYIVERLKEKKILTGTDGPFNNVLKLRPPMIINKQDVDYFLNCFAQILNESFLN